jgi:hypothetical protein
MVVVVVTRFNRQNYHVERGLFNPLETILTPASSSNCVFSGIFPFTLSHFLRETAQFKS